MDLEDKFKFGQYKGIKLIEVFQGSTSINIDLLTLYLKQLSDIPSIYKNNEDNSLFREFSNFKFNKDEISINFDIDELNELNANWSCEIEKYFKETNFQILRLFTNSLTLNNIILKNNKDTNISIIGDPYYIEWCIKNIKNFYINPSQINELNNIHFHIFNGISVSHKINNVYCFKPIYYSMPFYFSNKLINLNFEKYIELNFNKNKNNEQSYYDRLEYNQDEFCGGCESSPCRCSDSDPG